MHRLTVIAAAAMTLAAAASCSSNSSDMAAEEGTDSLTAAQQLRQRLDSVTAHRAVVFGHEDDPVYGHTWCGDSGRSDVLETAGDYPGLMGWDLGGLEKGDRSNLDSVNFERMRAEVIAQDARGGINAFSWHTVNPVNGLGSWDCQDTTIVAQMMADSAVTARFDAQLQMLADWFNSLLRPDGTKIGVIFRPWHEHTGNWFWWGADQTTPEQYAWLWKHTREVMDRNGVDNLLWAYSPDRVRDSSHYMERYPGDEYVDILGADVYAYGADKGVEQYRQAVDRTLGAACAVAAERGKLAAFTETGLEGVTMPGWWSEVLAPVLAEHPTACYVTVWRNAHDKPGHFYGPWPGHDSSESFRAFHALPRTVFASDMKQF